MSVEETLVLVKPDGVARNLTGEILARIEAKGYQLVDIKLVQADLDLLAAHYEEHQGKPFYEPLVEFMMSGPVVALRVAGNRVIEGFRSLAGTTDPTTAAPGTILHKTAITGLVGSDSIVGIDFRPGTGELFGLGSGSRLYVIDPVTAVATQVGTSGAFTLNGTSFGFDFNPVPDRIRVVSDADQNLRLNPGNGTLTATDGTLAFAVGDPNAGANANIVAAGYTNSFGGSTATTLYGIDSNLDTLIIQNPPNSGALNTVVGTGLGINALSLAGFDIQALSGGGNAAFAVFTTDGVKSGLYTINLTTGAASLVGEIGATATLLADVAIVPEITVIEPSPSPRASEALTTRFIRI